MQLVLRRLMKLLALPVLLSGTVSSEAATDWRYRLATSEAARAVYVSQPFATTASVAQLEKAFGEYLLRHGLPHDRPICPRSRSEEDALLAREDAIAFNRLRGLSPSASPASWRFTQ